MTDTRTLSERAEALQKVLRESDHAERFGIDATTPPTEVAAAGGER